MSLDNKSSKPSKKLSFSNKLYIYITRKILLICFPIKKRYISWPVQSSSVQTFSPTILIYVSSNYVYLFHFLSFVRPLRSQCLKLVSVRMYENQGSKGIRRLPINQCTSPIKIYKIIPSVDYN